MHRRNLRNEAVHGRNFPKVKSDPLAAGGSRLARIPSPSSQIQKDYSGHAKFRNTENPKSEKHILQNVSSLNELYEEARTRTYFLYCMREKAVFCISSKPF